MMTRIFWIPQAVTFLSALALVCAFAILSSRTLHLAIRTYSAQSVLLGIATLLLSFIPGRGHVFAIALMQILVKGLVIPWFLFKITEEIALKREKKPFIGPALSIPSAIGLTLLSYAALKPVAINDAQAAGGFAMALTLMQLGLLLMAARKKAITQIVGLLVVENGLFVAALSVSFGMPMVVELGLAFDLLVAVAVMGLMVFRIQNTFFSINTERLNRLRG